jgi:hypothetical protein
VSAALSPNVTWGRGGSKIGKKSVTYYLNRVCETATFSFFWAIFYTYVCRRFFSTLVCSKLKKVVSCELDKCKSNGGKANQEFW